MAKDFYETQPTKSITFCQSLQQLYEGRREGISLLSPA